MIICCMRCTKHISIPGKTLLSLVFEFVCAAVALHFMRWCCIAVAWGMVSSGNRRRRRQYLLFFGFVHFRQIFSSLSLTGLASNRFIAISCSNETVCTFRARSNYIQTQCWLLASWPLYGCSALQFCYVIDAIHAPCAFIFNRICLLLEQNIIIICVLPFSVWIFLCRSAVFVFRILLLRYRALKFTRTPFSNYTRGEYIKMEFRIRFNISRIFILYFFFLLLILFFCSFSFISSVFQSKNIMFKSAARH